MRGGGAGARGPAGTGERARGDAPTAGRRRAPQHSAAAEGSRYHGPFDAEEMKRVDGFLLRATPPTSTAARRPATAERPEIRTAYFSLAKEFHPDAYFGRDIGDTKAKLERIFRQITRAYEVLSRSKTRAEYDAYLKGQAVLAGHEEEEAKAWAEEPKPRPVEPPRRSPARRGPRRRTARPRRPQAFRLRRRLKDRPGRRTPRPPRRPA